MCKFKDTNLGIKKLDFNVKRVAGLIVHAHFVEDEEEGVTSPFL